MTLSRDWLSKIVVAAVALGVAYLAWQWLRPPSLPAGFASANGRIEAVDIDIAAKLPGRVMDILVNEGDAVRQGQVVANMDTRVLQSQRRETQAALEQARIGI